MKKYSVTNDAPKFTFAANFRRIYEISSDDIVFQPVRIVATLFKLASEK